MIAETVSHYAIGERLGAGGMGVVYRARDKMLGREVALKFVAAHLAGSEPFKERLIREARAISALSHPNVATIYEIGDSPEGLFLALEFLPGGTLRSKLEELKSTGQTFSVSEAVQIAIATGQGLAHAHRHGIVHRDIKPANLMFNADGIVKITDFGISKVADSQEITQPGALIGTRTYMSPEQARGEEVDERSDIYSLGMVVREMLAGAAAPTALLQVIDRATEADRNSRYQRVDDMLHDLRGLQHQTAEHTATIAAAPAAPRSLPLPLWIAAAILLLLAGGAWLRYGLHSKPPPRPRVIAVLPFTNIGADEAFCIGLVETLTTSITQLERFHSALVVVPASEVRDQGVESPSAARRAFGVNYAITGSVQRDAGRVLLTANLVDAGRLVQVEGRTILNRVDELDGLQEQVVSVVAELLDVQLRPDQRALLRAGQTPVAGAYDAFLQARGYLDRYDKPGNLERALELLQHAIRLDPRYALAYAAMSEAKWRKYNETNDPRLIQEARTLALQATGLDTRVPSAHVNLGIVYNATGRYDDAIREYSEALQTDPLSVEALRSLAETYQASGNSTEAEKVYRRAVQLRPNDWYTQTLLGMFYYRSGRHADAEPAFRNVVELTPDNFLAFANLGSSLLVLNQFAQAEENFRKSISLRASARGYTGLAGALFGQKRYAEAVALNERAAAMAPNSYSVWGNLADCYRWTPSLNRKASGAYRRAIENVDRVLNGNPTDAFARSSRAVFRAKLGDAPQALRDVRAARALAPADARVLFQEVVVEELAGERVRALESAAGALNAGYSPANFEADPELAGLARDRRFQELRQNYWRQHGGS